MRHSSIVAVVSATLLVAGCSDAPLAITEPSVESPRFSITPSSGNRLELINAIEHVGRSRIISGGTTTQMNLDANYGNSQIRISTSTPGGVIAKGNGEGWGVRMLDGPDLGSIDRQKLINGNETLDVTFGTDLASAMAFRADIRFLHADPGDKAEVEAFNAGGASVGKVTRDATGTQSIFFGQPFSRIRIRNVSAASASTFGLGDATFHLVANTNVGSVELRHNLMGLGTVGLRYVSAYGAPNTGTNVLLQQATPGVLTPAPVNIAPWLTNHVRVSSFTALGSRENRINFDNGDPIGVWSGSGLFEVNKTIDGDDALNIQLTGSVLGIAASIDTRGPGTLLVSADDGPATAVVLTNVGPQRWRATNIFFSLPFAKLTVRSAAGTMVQVHNVTINTVTP